jgi:hypothetical protein
MLDPKSEHLGKENQKIPCGAKLAVSPRLSH